MSQIFSEVINKYKKVINIVKIYIQIILLRCKIYMSKSRMCLFKRCLCWNFSIFVYNNDRLVIPIFETSFNISISK